MQYNNCHLSYNSKTCITMWKFKTIANGNIVYVSLLQQQGNNDFKFISVRFKLGCFQRKRRDIVIALSSSAAASASL